MVEDQIEDPGVEVDPCEFLVVVVPCVMMAVGLNECPVEEVQHAWLVAVDQHALQEGRRASLDVGPYALLAAVAQCSVVDQTECYVAAALNAEVVHQVDPTALVVFQQFQPDVTAVMAVPAGLLGASSVVVHLSGGVPESDETTLRVAHERRNAAG